MLMAVVLSLLVVVLVLLVPVQMLAEGQLGAP
jgi:hypothetical protein